MSFRHAFSPVASSYVGEVRVAVDTEARTLSLVIGVPDKGLTMVVPLSVEDTTYLCRELAKAVTLLLGVHRAAGRPGGDA